jgi:hypothetical protein
MYLNWKAPIVATMAVAALAVPTTPVLADAPKLMAVAACAPEARTLQISTFLGPFNLELSEGDVERLAARGIYLTEKVGVLSTCKVGDHDVALEITETKTGITDGFCGAAIWSTARLLVDGAPFLDLGALHGICPDSYTQVITANGWGVRRCINRDDGAQSGGCTNISYPE